MKLRKITTILIIIFVWTATQTFIFAFDTIDQSNSVDTVEVEQLLIEQVGEVVYNRMIEQIPALETYQALSKSFTNEKGDLLYPKGYAGEYISGDKLVVCYQKHTDTTFLDNYKNIEVKLVTHSYDDLSKNVVSLLGSTEDEYSIEFNPKSNQVVVHTVNQRTVNLLNEYTKSFEQKYVGSMIPLILETNTINSQSDADLVGGQDIRNSNGSEFTLGFCGTYNGDDAIITCGHSQSTLYDLKMYANPDIVGDFDYVRYNNNSYSDYSIATITNWTYDITNYVKFSSGYRNVTGVLLDAPVGTTLYRYGDETGYQAVEVTARNLSINTSESITIKGMTETEHISGTRSTDGDSGGPYYVLSYGSNCAAAGIHHGRNKSDNDLNYFTPAGDITNSFSFKIN